MGMYLFFCHAEFGLPNVAWFVYLRLIEARCIRGISVVDIRLAPV